MTMNQIFSIHALRTEGDRAGTGDDGHLLRFSIHALRTEGDRRRVRMG